LKRNFYKEGKRHTKGQERVKEKSTKVERERDEMTAVDEKSKGKAETMKQGKNSHYFFYL
jgi:hypothetical protein